MVLSASGGLERGKPEDYAHEVNLVAQRETVAGVTEAGLLVRDEDGSLPTISFLTSHQAWYLGRSMPDRDGVLRPIGSWEAINDRYGRVAESKRAGVDMLMDMQPELDARLLVSSTDLIPDSGVAAAAAILGFKDESDKGLSKDDRRQLQVSRLVAARQAELTNLGLDPKLYSSIEFSSATVREALNPEWMGIGLLLLPDHQNEDTFNRFGNLEQG